MNPTMHERVWSTNVTGTSYTPSPAVMKEPLFSADLLRAFRSDKIIIIRLTIREHYDISLVEWNHRDSGNSGNSRKSENKKGE